jgi:hypothetical protein
MQPTQNSEPHGSHAINCPGMYQLGQLSQFIPFTDHFEESDPKVILGTSRGNPKDPQARHIVRPKYEDGTKWICR